MRVIFERGVFTMADTQVVSQVQAFLLLQIPLYLVGILVVRLVSALKANSILMWGCVINFVVNIIYELCVDAVAPGSRYCPVHSRGLSSVGYLLVRHASAGAEAM